MTGKCMRVDNPQYTYLNMHAIRNACSFSPIAFAVVLSVVFSEWQDQEWTIERIMNEEVSNNSRGEIRVEAA